MNGDGLLAALKARDFQRVDDALWSDTVDIADLSVDVLNELLSTVGHHHHQAVARELQRSGNDVTVEHVRTWLHRGFADLDYTCSDDGVIAKWFSWTLAGIGSPAAIAALNEFAASPNAEIAEAMRYRLERSGG